MAQTPVLEFHDITVMRGETAALRNFSLAVAPGEHIAIVGPNGSGKSTLAKTMLGECRPLVRPGSFVRLLGEERWKLFDVRAKIGIVSPDWVTICTRPVSVREAVLSGFFSSAEIWPHQQVTTAMERQADEVISHLELGHLAAKEMTDLSSGESRRVLIARAIVWGPEALVLDEPSVSLDFRALAELHETMRKLARSGVTLILVTHHLPDIIPEIKRVVLLKQGRIVRDGKKEELLTGSELSSLYDMPLEVVRNNGYYQLLL